MTLKYPKTVLVILMTAGLGVLCAVYFLSSQRRLTYQYPPLLSAPFDVAAIRNTAGKPDTKAFSCPNTPPPIIDLHFESIYSPAERNASVIDPEAYDTYLKTSKPLRKYESSLTGMANRYVLSNPAHPELALCVQDWLYDWAVKKALLGDVNRSGELVRKWSLASLSLAWLQVQNDPALDPEKTVAINQWLRRTANTVKGDFSKNTGNASRQNNHLYWAAWAVASTGIALQDPVMFDWAIKRANRGIHQIDKEATLPLELHRGRKAFQYHNFAATPLFLLAQTASANKINLFDESDQALKRLGTLLLDNMKDPSYFVEKTGEKQDLTRTITSSNLVWVEIFDLHYGTQASHSLLQNLRPMRSSRTGGDSTMLYRGVLIPSQDKKL